MRKKIRERFMTKKVFNRIYLEGKDFEGTVLKIGDKLKYHINPETKVVRISLNENLDRQVTVSYRKPKLSQRKENDTRLFPVVDIGNKDVIKNFGDCTCAKFIIYEDGFEIIPWDEGAQSLDNVASIETDSPKIKRILNGFTKLMGSSNDLAVRCAQSAPTLTFKSPEFEKGINRSKKRKSEQNNQMSLFDLGFSLSSDEQTQQLSQTDEFKKEHPNLVKTLKVFSLFSGIGAFEMALRNLGIKHQLLKYCEVDKYASKSYSAIHDVSEEMNLGDITQVDLDTLPQDVDLITHGSPCFPKGTIVTTDKGYKLIEDIQIGDKVLTHTNTFKTVYELMKNKSSDIYTINAQCSFPFDATGNHPFYVRKKEYIFNKHTRNNERVFSEPEWKWLRDLSQEYYVGVATNQNSKYPDWNGVENNQKNNVNKIDNLNHLFSDMRFWYLVGRFIGDGWTTILFNKTENKPTYRTTICCSHDELIDLESKIGGILPYCVVRNRTTYNLQFSNKELTLFLKQFGTGAKNKMLTNSILDLPNAELESFFKGYIDSDGCFSQNAYKFTSVSKTLLLGVGQVITKLYKVPFSIGHNKRPRTKVIEGRTINQSDTYQLIYRPNATKTQGFYEDGILWVPIRNITKKDCNDIVVYNFEVEEDHSYVVNNIIVHNCQDFSTAGKGLGGDEGTQTRSSLMWNAVEFIRRCLPRFVIWENVKGVLSKTNKHNYDKYLEQLEILGYSNSTLIINAKDFGLPQNRERLFVVSAKEEITFDSPNSFPSTQCIEDILETKVEDSRYVQKTYKLLNETDLSQSERIIHKVAYVPYAKNPEKVHQSNTIYHPKGISPAVYRDHEKQPLMVLEENPFDLTGAEEHQYRIRRLSALEHWRLMGFSDEDYTKASDVCSKTQIYRQVGNSIALPVIECIFYQLLKGTEFLVTKVTDNVQKMLDADASLDRELFANI